jgi:hypothetical protein
MYRPFRRSLEHVSSEWPVEKGDRAGFWAFRYAECRVDEGILVKLSDNIVAPRADAKLVRPAASSRRWLLLASILVGASAAMGHSAVALAETEAGVPGATAEKSTGKVDLSRLLKLPDSYQRPGDDRSGPDRQEWMSRFKVVRSDLDESKAALAKAQDELAEAASGSGSYSVAAPGTTSSPEDTPLSYKLRQEIRRQRELVDRAEYKMRELNIEADLASVPTNWRGPAEGDASPE